MIFYIYLDPDALSPENIENEYAMQALIGTLRAFTQNCCIAESEDYRVHNAIKENVNNLPDTYERKLVKKLLAFLEKRNRFIYCYMITDQFVIDLGRGMDFLDRKTRRNRDLTVGYKSFKETDTLLKNYASAKLTRILI